MSGHEEFKLISTPEGTTLAPCPVCGTSSELWRRSESPSAPSHVAVCCANGESIGPQNALMSEGCLLFMPPEDFYRSTIREAVQYWTEFASALQILQRANRWKNADVMRDLADKPAEKGGA